MLEGLHRWNTEGYLFILALFHLMHLPYPPLLQTLDKLGD